MQQSDQNSSTRVLQWATLLSILAAIAVNAFSNIAPPNGLNIGAIANTILRGVLITPANYAFSIWGLIYVGLIAFGIYQLQSSQRYNSRLHPLRIPIIASSIFQIAWVFLFQYQQFWLSVPVMLGILVSLAIAFLAIHPEDHRISRQEKWFAQIPVSIYFGWISVATIVNVASALYASNWDGSGASPVVWTVIMSAIAAAITAIVAIQFRDAAFPLVTVWALVAIAVRQSSQPAILWTSLGFAIALAVLTLFTQIQSRRKSR